MSKLDQVCQDYAVSKYASAQDARIAMLEDIAALRAQRDDLLAAAKQAEKWIAIQMADNGCPADRLANPPEGSHLFNLRAAISKATASAA